MHINILHLAGIDSLAQVLIALIRGAEIDSMSAGKLPIARVASGRASEQVNLELTARIMFLLSKAGDSSRELLGRARCSEAAGGDLIPILYQPCSFGRTHKIVCHFI